MPPRSRVWPSPCLKADSRGTVTVEYALLLALVAIGAAAALVSLGVPLIQLFVAQRAVLLLPIP
jgi:Flp pilus assembly pilin Flp